MIIKSHFQKELFKTEAQESHDKKKTPLTQQAKNQTTVLKNGKRIRNFSKLNIQMAHAKMLGLDDH